MKAMIQKTNPKGEQAAEKRPPQWASASDWGQQESTHDGTS